MIVSKPNLYQTYTKLQWLPKHTKAKFQTDILRHYMILPALSCFVTRVLALSTRVPAQWMLFLDQEKCIVTTRMRHHEIVVLFRMLVAGNPKGAVTEAHSISRRSNGASHPGCLFTVPSMHRDDPRHVYDNNTQCVSNLRFTSPFRFKMCMDASFGSR